MADLATSANKEFNNSFDETKCPLCNNQYDEEIRIPRILLNCGHTICSLCISSSNNSNSILKCPEDNTEYQNITLASFPINKALLRLLHKISESKKNNEENSLTKIVSIKTPKTSPEKRLNTARASRINLENLKLISNKIDEGLNNYHKIPRTSQSKLGNDLLRRQKQNMHKLCHFWKA